MQKDQKEKQTEEDPKIQERLEQRKALLRKLFRANRQKLGNSLLQEASAEDEKLLAAFKHYKFGAFCLQGNDIERAQQHLLKAGQVIELKYPFSNLHMNMGNIWAQRRDYKKAIEQYEKVLEQSPHKNPEQYDNKYDIVFSKHLNSYNAYVDAHTNLAVMYVQMDEFEKGFNYCKKALQLQPDSSESQVNFTDILRQLGKKDQAIKQSWQQIVDYTRKNGRPDYEGFKGVQIIPWKVQEGAKPTEQDKNISILTVKWGARYDADYVNKLYLGILRNTTWKITFYCFTDDSKGLHPDIKIEQLEEGWKRWWGKVTLFNVDIPGRKFYIDLDMIIVGSLDQLFSYGGTFATLRTGDLACEKNHKEGYNSSVMIWQDDKLKPVYQTLKDNFEGVSKYIVRFDFWLEMTIKNADYVQTLFPGKVIDFLADAQKQLPQGSAVVCFARKPKPEDYPAPWVKEYWVL